MSSAAGLSYSAPQTSPTQSVADRGGGEIRRPDLLRSPIQVAQARGSRANGSHRYLIGKTFGLRRVDVRSSFERGCGIWKSPCGGTESARTDQVKHQPFDRPVLHLCASVAPNRQVQQ